MASPVSINTTIANLKVNATTEMASHVVGLVLSNVSDYLNESIRYFNNDTNSDVTTNATRLSSDDFDYSSAWFVASALGSGAFVVLTGIFCCYDGCQKYYAKNLAVKECKSQPLEDANSSQQNAVSTTKLYYQLSILDDEIDMVQETNDYTSATEELKEIVYKP